MHSEIFQALVNEACFTNDILGAGATQIRKGNYAQKGMYFQSFTSLSTGLERIGKLCLMLDYYIDHQGKFPDFNFMKKEIGHDLELLYKKSQEIKSNKSIELYTLQNIDGEIHQNILRILSSFAKGDRYSNINLLTNGKQQSDPVLSWAEAVDQLLYDEKVSARKKQKIEDNARLIHNMTNHFTMVRHTSETGSEINDVFEGSLRGGIFEAVAPLRQLYILQIIRYWVEFIRILQYKAMEMGAQDIPFFTDIFAPFFNDDKYLKTRKTWDKF